MATNMTTTKNNACLYGLRFGCMNTTNDPNCTRCADRLASAVNQVLRPMAKTHADDIASYTTAR
jgi:hypothetical protein